MTAQPSTPHNQPSEVSLFDASTANDNGHGHDFAALGQANGKQDAGGTAQSMVDHAKLYARRGWPVFPTSDAAKRRAVQFR